MPYAPITPSTHPPCSAWYASCTTHPNHPTNSEIENLEADVSAARLDVWIIGCSDGSNVTDFERKSVIFHDFAAFKSLEHRILLSAIDFQLNACILDGFS
jgi:hypothetical protein